MRTIRETLREQKLDRAEAWLSMVKTVESFVVLIVFILLSMSKFIDSLPLILLAEVIIILGINATLGKAFSKLFEYNEKAKEKFIHDFKLQCAPVLLAGTAFITLGYTLSKQYSSTITIILGIVYSLIALYHLVNYIVINNSLNKVFKNTVCNVKCKERIIRTVNMFEEYIAVEGSKLFVKSRYDDATIKEYSLNTCVVEMVIKGYKIEINKETYAEYM